MINLTPSSSKQETRYLNVLKTHTKHIVLAKENAPLEGFEYFSSDEYRKKIGKKGNLFTDKFRSMSRSNLPRFFKIFIDNMFGIFSARRNSFTDIADYLVSLERTGTIDKSPGEYLESYPNSELWKDLSDYAWGKWRVKLGFTEVPTEIIFQNKAILFKYSLVALQEMDKEKIDKAPDPDAGEEVLAVYKSLGLAVTDIARWLRRMYGIRCQANHPLGGLVNTVPLAVKAGMGWSGSNGLFNYTRIWATAAHCANFY